ncbi:hypothetical protein [Nocardia sp. NPDC024068]|uniref:hypothetical protein n=1 Tax=Nocardia sp. NPDC024068 TaxID=3157197 RepID=UPI0033EC26A7
MSDDMDDWNSIVRTLLNHVRFEPRIDEAVARNVAVALVEDPLWKLTPDQEYEILSTALRNLYPVPPERPSKMDDREVLDFLSMIVSQMDALRPWPIRPYDLLPEERLSEFATLTPIAAVDLAVDEIEDRIDQLFDFDENYGEFLLIRLKSGHEVGFLSPDESADGTVAVVGTAAGDPAREILDELAAASGLDRALFAARG